MDRWTGVVSRDVFRIESVDAILIRYLDGGVGFGFDNSSERGVW